MAVSVEKTLQQFINSPILFIYQILQFFIDKLLAPNAPTPRAELSRPKIAIIGAGLTGVSAASHVVGHGFDCTLFEAGDRKSLGGIWSVRILNCSACFTLSNAAHRKSTIPRAFKSIVSCTDFILP